MPNPIQAVIFDQDGLMFDTESLAATSWFEVGPKYGIHVDGNFLRGIRGCKPDKGSANTPTAGLRSMASR